MVSADLALPIATSQSHVEMDAEAGSANRAAETPPSAQFDAAQILASVGEVAYDWRIETDVLLWGQNVAQVLLIHDPSRIATGRAFAELLEAENVQARFDAVMQSRQRDEGHGVGYQIQYCLRPEAGSETKLWIEDTGRWFADATGRPIRALGVLRVINERYEHERKLSFLARCDGLTGELNRHRLTEVLEDTIEETLQSRSSCGFLLVGVDDLTRINDAYGFDVADQVIAAIARRLRSRMRGKDTLGRFSGSKFGLVLRDCTPDDMAIAAERMLAGVRADMIPTSAGPIAATVTIGGVTAPRHARSAAEMLSRAHESLDGAKTRRRGSYSPYRPNIERDAVRRENARITEEIIAALNERRVFLAYETVATAADRRPAFYECLMRIRRSDGSLLPASNIVPAAERLGLVRLLDFRVLELVVDELTAAPALQASVNVSPASTADPDWWAGLASLLRAHTGLAGRLIVEITESAAIQDIEETRGFVARVKDDRAFVRTLLDLASRLGLKTVAEWVPDEPVAQTLQMWGCDYLQGAWIGLASTERPWIASGAATIAI